MKTFLALEPRIVNDLTVYSERGDDVVILSSNTPIHNILIEDMGMLFSIYGDIERVFVCDKSLDEKTIKVACCDLFGQRVDKGGVVSFLAIDRIEPTN